MLNKSDLVDVHLFGGAGGMAIGLREAGFGSSLIYEMDPFAQATLQANSTANVTPPDWDNHRGDVRSVDWNLIDKPVQLLAGGVPCQPFSLAGKHLAERDGRNLFPEYFRAARALRPQAMFVENVAGLVRASFRPYFDYILRQMAFPSIAPQQDELWQEHDARLIQLQSASGTVPEYNVITSTVNAADYGVPQRRRRVFLVATRADFPVYEFPPPTHSQTALVRTQLSGVYWDRYELPTPPRLKKLLPADDEKLPWVTVRDALDSLLPPAPTENGSDCNHWMIPGAKSYKGHTGSPLDWPSKALKAGVHGVPGGENTLIEDCGQIRYYTLREAARIQTFPDDYTFSGARIHVTRQIGNAVPCMLAEKLAKPLRDILSANNPES